MIKRNYSLGEWNNPDPQTLPEGALALARNVEYDGNSLKPRTDPDLYANGLNKPKYFTIWYPSTMPSGWKGDHIFVEYRETTNRLYLSYYNGDMWIGSVITIDDVNYTSESVFDFAPFKDEMIIVDGVNRPHFIKIDEEGDITSGVRGYAAPTTKAEIESMTDWDGNKFQEVSTEPRFSDLGVFEITYIYKDIFGNKSNPAPISRLMVDYQWFRIEDDSEEDNYLEEDRFLKKVIVSNAQLPLSLSSGLKKHVTEFTFFYRLRRYSEDPNAGSFSECLTTKIVNKNHDSNANTYAIVTEISDLAPTASYDNDIPPVAGLVEVSGATTVYANVSEELPFPFTFKYNKKLPISNVNSATMSGANIRYRILESNVENFLVEDFITAGDLANTEHIRFYDTDLTTPLPVLYYGHSILDGWMDVLICIPQMLGGSSDDIYLCFNPEAYQIAGYGTEDRYDTEDAFGYSHGRFCDYRSDLENNQNIQAMTCKSARNIVCSPMEEENWADDDKAPNRFDTSTDGVLTNATWAAERSYSFIPMLGEYGRQYSKDSIRFSSNEGRIRYGEEIFADNSGEVASAYGFISFTKANLQEYDDGGLYFKYNVICGNYGKAASVTEFRGWAFGIKYEDGDLIPCLWYQVGDAKFKEAPFQIMNDASTYPIFYSISVDFDSGKAYCYIHDYAGNISVAEEAVLEDYENYDPSSNQDVNVGHGGTTLLYEAGSSYYGFYGISGSYDSGFNFLKDTYIDGDGVHEALNNFQPYFDTEYIGWNGSENKNIDDTEDVEENVKEKNAAKLVWTPENGRNVPAINEKYIFEPIVGIIEAKSFLQQSYQNSLLITSRNALHRFVIEEAEFSSIGNMIKEFSQNGQLSSNIIAMGEAWWWGSEAGIMKWSPSGIRIISNGIINGSVVKRIDINISGDTILVPIPIKRQILIWNRTIGNESGYIYDVDGDRFTSVTGFDIQDFAVLTQGSQVDNKTMFLNSENNYYEYPGAANTTQQIYVTTKSYELDDMKFRKFRANAEGSPSIITSVTNVTGTKNSINDDVVNMRWYGLPSGSWGYKYYHQISDFTKLNYLIEKFLKRG